MIQEKEIVSLVRHGFAVDLVEGYDQGDDYNDVFVRVRQTKHAKPGRVHCNETDRQVADGYIGVLTAVAAWRQLQGTHTTLLRANRVIMERMRKAEKRLDSRTTDQWAFGPWYCPL